VAEWWANELSAHLLKRMEDRRFTEVDLMIEHAQLRPDILEVVSTPDTPRALKSSSSPTSRERCWS
jgi:hypothetical protein